MTWKKKRSEPFMWPRSWNVYVRAAGCIHKQGMCYRPLCFVCEARVQQGLTAWAFKGVSLAGTKTQPLHHEEADNLINVTIYSTHPYACLRHPDALLLALSIELNKTTFWILVICSDRTLEARKVAAIPLEKIFVLILLQLFFSERNIPCLHCMLGP